MTDTGNDALRAAGVPVDSDEHIAVIVGPVIRQIYGDTAELGHYKLAIAIYKMAVEAACETYAAGAADATERLEFVYGAVEGIRNALTVLGPDANTYQELTDLLKAIRARKEQGKEKS